MFERFREIVSENQAERQRKREEEDRIQQMLDEAQEDIRKRVDAVIEEKAEKRRGKYPGLDDSAYHQGEREWIDTVTEDAMRKKGLL